MSIAVLALLWPAAVAWAGPIEFAMIPPIEEPGAPTELPPSRTARLAWHDPADLLPGYFGGIKEETARILQGMGASTVWRRADSRDLARMDEISVIFVAHGPRPVKVRQSVVMGSTPTEVKPHRAVWVHTPQVLAALGLSTLRQSQHLAPREHFQFTRALARVIVHEVIHALAPEVPHGSGIMCEQLSYKQLTSDVLEVEPMVRAAVQAALARPPFFVPPPRAEGASSAALASVSESPSTRREGGIAEGQSEVLR
jgi:hypothetical protein